MQDPRPLHKRAKVVIAFYTLTMFFFAMVANVVSLAVAGKPAVPESVMATLAAGMGFIGTWFMQAQGKVDTAKAKNGHTEAG